MKVKWTNVFVVVVVVVGRSDGDARFWKAICSLIDYKRFFLYFCDVPTTTRWYRLKWELLRERYREWMFFSFLVFNTQLKVYREMFCKSCWRLEWIRTWALWFRKQLLCKLHQCAKREYFFFIILADNLCTSQKFTYLKWSTLFYWQITIFLDRGELDPIMLNCGLQGWQCWWQFNGLEITGDPLKLLRAGMAAT